VVLISKKQVYITIEYSGHYPFNRKMQSKYLNRISIIWDSMASNCAGFKIQKSEIWINASLKDQTVELANTVCITLQFMYNIYTLPPSLRYFPRQTHWVEAANNLCVRRKLECRQRRTDKRIGRIGGYSLRRDFFFWFLFVFFVFFLFCFCSLFAVFFPCA